MKRLTKEIEKRFEKVGSQYGKGDEAKVIVKYFNPCGAGTWWATELEEYRMEKNGEYKAVYTLTEKDEMLKDDWRVDDLILFGMAEITDKEWGSFSLKELQEAQLPFGLRIERDLHFGERTIRDTNYLK